jgi:hypothetical protein
MDLKVWDLWSGSIWLRTGPSGGMFKARQFIFSSRTDSDFLDQLSDYQLFNDSVTLSSVESHEVRELLESYMHCRRDS